METLQIKYALYARALPPRPIKITIGGWAGTPEKMEDGSDPQPWHCLPFVEGSTHGLELLYPYEKECHVVNDNGNVRFDWDFANEPGGGVTGAEFVMFSPVKAAQYYLFNARTDIQPPPGYVLRTEPHPRFFTDSTGTVPCALIGHLQNEWYSRMTFVVFRAPRPGQRHIFRQGEPFVQLIFVRRVSYELTPMTNEEQAPRRALEEAIQRLRYDFAENVWTHPDGARFNNHYKVLARAFARDGMAGIDAIIKEAGRKHALKVPEKESIAEALAQGQELILQHKYDLAREVYQRVLSQEPNNAHAICHLGICVACRGDLMRALTLMKQAVDIEPRVPRFHSTLAQLLRRLGRLQEAETSIRWALELDPEDLSVLAVLAHVQAEQGRTAEALATYRAASARGTLSTGAHFDMGVLLARNGQLAEARACFETTLALDPNFASAKQALAELAARGT
jgi:Flp pilus assembly protein TadD